MHTLVSIFHRVTGHALAFGALLFFAWWLVAAASSREHYELFLDVARSPVGWIIAVGLSWVFFQHLLSGLRHLLMDTGWGFEIGVAKTSATSVFVGGVILTALFWAIVFFAPGLR